MHSAGRPVINAIILTSILAWNSSYLLLGQADNEEVRSRIHQSIEQIESYAALKLKIEYRLRTSETNATVQILGEQVWQEFESISTDEETAQVLANRQSIRKAIGCELPVIHAFDGKNAYTFNPYQLEMTIQPSTKYPSGGARIESFRPSEWLSLDDQGSTKCKDVLQSSKPRSVIRAIDGGWHIGIAGLGADLPPEIREKLLFTEQGFEVSPRSNYLPVKYSGISGSGIRREGEYQWEETDGRWYLKHAKHLVDGRTMSEWTISEISFDAKQCRSRFDDLEQLVPFGTKITQKDAKRKVVSERYKGGAAGKEEHELRRLAVMRSKGAKK